MHAGEPAKKRVIRPSLEAFTFDTASARPVKASGTEKQRKGHAGTIERRLSLRNLSGIRQPFARDPFLPGVKSVARRFYNGDIRDLRNKCECFPSKLIARAFGFQPEGYFTVPPAMRKCPTCSSDHSRSRNLNRSLQAIERTSSRRMAESGGARAADQTARGSSVWV